MSRGATCGVDQPIWKPETLKSYMDLVELITERSEAIDQQVLFVP